MARPKNCATCDKLFHPQYDWHTIQYCGEDCIKKAKKKHRERAARRAAMEFSPEANKLVKFNLVRVS